MLFTDGMRVGWADLRSAWRLPGRALGWGLPLTLLVTALLAHYVAGLDWPEALLIGAILAPTDPVFAAALVGNDKVPGRLRHLLNVESGVNDGLALPFVVVLLAVAAGSGDLHLGTLGLGTGRWASPSASSCRGWRSGWNAPAGSRCHRQYLPLNAVAIGLLVLALGKATHGNLFLAAFAAGITVATVGPAQREAFEHFGELVAEILKLAALLVFGALLAPAFFADIAWTGWVFAVLALVARPAGRAVDLVPARRARAAGAVRRDVVRPERLRLRRLRPARARLRHRRRRRDLPPRRAHHRPVDPRPLLHRRPRRPHLRRRPAARPGATGYSTARRRLRRTRTARQGDSAGGSAGT